MLLGLDVGQGKGTRSCLRRPPPSGPGVPRFHRGGPLIRRAARAGQAPRPSGALTSNSPQRDDGAHVPCTAASPVLPASGPLNGDDTKARTGPAAPPSEQSRESCPGSLPPSLSPTTTEGAQERSLPSRQCLPSPPTLPGPLPHDLLTLLGHQAQPQGRHRGLWGSVPGAPSPRRRQVDPGGGGGGQQPAQLSSCPPLPRGPAAPTFVTGASAKQPPASPPTPPTSGTASALSANPLPAAGEQLSGPCAEGLCLRLLRPRLQTLHVGLTGQTLRVPLCPLHCPGGGGPGCSRGEGRVPPRSLS